MTVKQIVLDLRKYYMPKTAKSCSGDSVLTLVQIYLSNDFIFQLESR